MPLTVQPALRRLARRLAIGLFLDVWPRWAVATLVVAGVVAVVCRMFFPSAAPALTWLWLAPVLAAVPALIAGFVRPYRPAEVVAVADWLSGGDGMLLTLFETNDRRWVESPRFDKACRFPLPRLRGSRGMAAMLPAAAFLAVALWLPQRRPSDGSTALLADEMAADLAATVLELKREEMVTPEEERTLSEEIERLRRSARERVDAGSWEAADTVRENVAARVAGKQDAVKWAQDSLARYAAAAKAGAGESVQAGAEADAAELTKALEKLAQNGLLAGAPADLQQLLAGGKLPTDPKLVRQLAATLSKYLAETGGKLGKLARLGKDPGKFDPSEFPLDSDDRAAAGNEMPGRGGITRGRADAALTWGNETLPFDRFKAQPLPPGAARSPDDWAPVAELPGTPQESPQLSAASSSRQYAAAAGQSAWRRTLAPRHQSAVKKYFDK